MPKGQRKQPVTCPEHNFSLQPLRNGLHFKETVSVSFCKGKIESKAKSKKSQLPQSCLCCPVFNKDRSHATSAFILPEEQGNFIENTEKFKQEHDGKIHEYNDEKSQMLVPKPKTRYSYCSVCKANYDDYLNHIQSNNHKASIRSNNFNRLILEHEKKYEAINIGRKIKTKSADNTETNFPIVIQSDECEEMGMPSKRVKRDSNPVSCTAPRLSHSQIKIPSYPMPTSYSPFGSQIHGNMSQHFPMMPAMQMPPMPPMMQPMMLPMMAPPYHYIIEDPWRYYYNMMNNSFHSQMGYRQLPPVIDLEAANP